MKIKIFVIAAILASAVSLSAQSLKLEAALSLPDEKISIAPDSENAKAESKPLPSPSKQNGYVRPSPKKRFNHFVNNVVGPFSLLGTGISAGISTATNEPEEWGKGGKGYARRFASNLATGAIRETTIYAIDEALRIDSKFYRSEKRDAGSKIKNAFLSTLTARDKNGKRVFGVSRLAATYSAAIIKNETWMPDRFSYKDGLREGSISLGVNTAFNLVREFLFKK